MLFYRISHNVELFPQLLVKYVVVECFVLLLVFDARHCVTLPFVSPLSDCGKSVRVEYIDK